MVRLLIIVVTVLAVWVGTGTADLAVRPDRRQGPVGKDQLLVDGLVDNVLYTVRRELGRVGLGTTELPDIRDVQQAGLRLSLTEGMMHSLSTLHRAAPGALAEYGEGNVSLSTVLSLETLEVGYLVSAKYGFLPAITSNVGAVVKTNRIRLAAGIFYVGDNCHLGVEALSVTELRDIEWRTSGFGVINSIVSAALNLVVPPERLRGWINDAFSGALQQFREPCHRLIPGLGPGMAGPC